jgi:hypothetical protein
MHHLASAILEGDVAVVARAQIGLIQGRQRVAIEVTGAGIDLRIEPGAAMAGLPASAAVESALAVRTGDESGVGDRQIEVPAAT